MHATECCLIIDDSDVVRKVMRITVEGLGFTAEEAATAADGLSLCRAKMPEVILLDWHLPGSNTLEFLAAVRSLPHGRQVKILYVASNNDPSEIGRAIAAGANDHMIKPFHRVTLEAKIARLTAKVPVPKASPGLDLRPRRAVGSG